MSNVIDSVDTLDQAQGQDLKIPTKTIPALRSYEATVQ